MSLQATGDLGLYSGGTELTVVQVALVEVLRALCRVNMRIDETRQHDAPAEIDDACLRPGERAHIRVRADCQDAPAADCERIDDAMRGVLRMNARVCDHEFRRVPRLAGAGAQQQSE